MGDILGLSDFLLSVSRVIIDVHFVVADKELAIDCETKRVDFKESGIIFHEALVESLDNLKEEETKMLLQTPQNNEISLSKKSVIYVENLFIEGVSNVESSSDLLKGILSESSVNINEERLDWAFFLLLNIDTTTLVADDHNTSLSSVEGNSQVEFLKR